MFRRSSWLAAGFVLMRCLIPCAALAQTVDDIIATNLKSKGGLEKIKAIQTVRMTGSVMARDATGRDVTGTMTMVAKRPNLMRRDAEVGQRIVNAFDGTSLWMMIGSNPPQQLPNTQTAYARQDAEFDSVFVDYKDKGTRIELVGKETVADTPVYHLKVTKKAGPPQDYYLDVATGLEKRLSVSLQAPDGSSVQNVTDFSDYRSVDGCMVPFMLRQRQNQVIVATTTLDKVEFNVPIEDSYFKMPSSK
jgi:outer membrane lipoprotein-sorting protein